MSRTSNDEISTFAAGLGVGILAAVVLLFAAAAYVARTLSATRSKLLLCTVCCLAAFALLAVVTRSAVPLSLAILSAVAAPVIALALNGRSPRPSDPMAFRVPEFKEPRW